MSVSLLKNGCSGDSSPAITISPSGFVPSDASPARSSPRSSSLSSTCGEEGAERAYRVQTSAIQVRFLDLLARTSSLDGLANDPTSVLDFVDAQGAAIVQGGKCTLLGQTPDEAEIPGLIDLMTGSLDQGVYATDSLSASYPRRGDIQGRRQRNARSGDLARAWRLSPLVPARAGSHGQLGRQSRQTRELREWDCSACTRASRSSSGRRRSRSIRGDGSPARLPRPSSSRQTLRSVIAGDGRLRCRGRRQDAVTELGQRALASTDIVSLFRTPSSSSRGPWRSTFAVCIQKFRSRRIGDPGRVSPPDIAEILPALETPTIPWPSSRCPQQSPVMVNDLLGGRFDGRPTPTISSGATSGIAVPMRRCGFDLRGHDRLRLSSAPVRSRKMCISSSSIANVLDRADSKEANRGEARAPVATRWTDRITKSRPVHGTAARRRTSKCTRHWRCS